MWRAKQVLAGLTRNGMWAAPLHQSSEQYTSPWMVVVMIM